MAKKLAILLVAAVISLNLPALAISAGMGDDVKGTVTKIEGGAVTIKDATGIEQTVEPKNPDALTDLKVGDQATVKDGMLMKGDGMEPAAPSPGPKY